MRNTISILAVVVLTLVSCEETIDKSRPSHLPPDLPYEWGPFERAAWNEGRLHYNEDSTLCIITSDRNLTKEHVEQLNTYNAYFDSIMDPNNQ